MGLPLPAGFPVGIVIVCLLAALQFHGLGNRTPFETWLAIGVKDRKPTVPDLPIRIVEPRPSPAAQPAEDGLVDRRLPNVRRPLGRTDRLTAAGETPSWRDAELARRRAEALPLGRHDECLELREECRLHGTSSRLRPCAITARTRSSSPRWSY
jgi:hypothetical protein